MIYKYKPYVETGPFGAMVFHKDDEKTVVLGSIDGYTYVYTSAEQLAQDERLQAVVVELDERELESLKIRNSLILRTNFFGWNIQNKNSLGEWILEALKGKKPINGFKDAYFSSIYTMELARLIDIAIKENITGVYNCGSIDSCSKYDFCLRIADVFGFDRGLVTPISIDDFNFHVNRGKNLSLNVHKLQKNLNAKIKTINDSIQAFYNDYTRGFHQKIKDYLK